jgi:prevent-host-death family protein
MSNVPENELEQNLDSILTRAQSERIVTSRHGKPCAVLIGIEDYDSEDVGLASSEDFWRRIRQRRASGKSLPLAEVEARLRIKSGKPAGKRPVTRKGRKHSCMQWSLTTRHLAMPTRPTQR